MSGKIYCKLLTLLKKKKNWDCVKHLQMARFSIKIQSTLTLHSNYDQVTPCTLWEHQRFHGVKLDLNCHLVLAYVRELSSTFNPRKSAFYKFLLLLQLKVPLSVFFCFLFFGIKLYKLKPFRLKFLRCLLTALGYCHHRLKNQRYILAVHKQVLINFFSHCSNLRRFSNNY